MKILKVKTHEDTCTITIDAWGIGHSCRQIQKYLTDKRIFIITNKTIQKIYQKKLHPVFKKFFEPVWISIPDGEQYKNLKTCENIWTTLSRSGAHRGSHLLSLGGGVVGDITGFVASAYMRGIPYFQMPTTLLAQVDSSVGGKTGVDLVTGKNLVGAFYQPKAVFIHTDFLKTLPAREFRCGMAEVIKYGIIRDKKIFQEINKNHHAILQLKPAPLSNMIYTCCAIKADIVQKDEKEAEIRAILNFGHTIGHAIELMSGFKKFKHGEAVAIGMCCAARISHDLKLSKKNHETEIASILQKYSLKCALPRYTIHEYMQAIQRDKKNTQKEIRFILIKDIGRAAIISLNKTGIKKCMTQILKD